MRLSILVAKKFNFSRRYAKFAIKNGLISVDNVITKNDVDISSDNINFHGIINNFNINEEDFILKKYQDIIFIYKPPFIHYERLKPEDNITISDVVSKFSGYKSISRLDYETDGIIAIIKDDYKINYMKKRYLAIVEGSFPNNLRIKWSIDADNKKKVKVIEDDLGNETILNKITEKNNLSLIEVFVEKASRHQIRAVCANSGYPLLGDKLYGGKNYERLCLHSESITINDTTCNTGKYKDKFLSIIDYL